MIEIVPATAEMIAALQGRPAQQTTRAIAAVKDGRVLGAAGYFVRDATAVAWLQAGEELRRHPRVLILGARLLLRRLAELDMPIIASCDRREPSAERFLAHWGFVHLTGDIYLWET